MYIWLPSTWSMLMVVALGNVDTNSMVFGVSRLMVATSDIHPWRTMLFLTATWLILEYSGTESRPTQSSSNVVVFPPTTLFDTTNSSPSIADDPPAGDFSSRRKAPNRDTPVELRMMLNARLSVHITRLMNVALTANILWTLEAEPAKTMFWKLVIRFRRMNTRRIVSLPPPAPTQSTQAKPDVVVWLTPSNLQSSTRTSPIPEKLTVTGDPTPAGVKTQRWMAT